MTDENKNTEPKPKPTHTDWVESVVEQLKKASPERCQAVDAFLRMSEDRADVLGEALHLAEAGYNIAQIRGAALQTHTKIKMVRSRTPVRYFAYPGDLDDPSMNDASYRGFYVMRPTEEQVASVQREATRRIKFLAKKGINLDEDGRIQLDFLDDPELEEFLAEPTAMYRHVVIENIREVEVSVIDSVPSIKKDENGNIIHMDMIGPDLAKQLCETELIGLTSDYMLLLSEQGLTAKNSPMTGI
jgi:hypothetical protein